MNRLEQKVFELAEMPAKEIGCYIYDVEYLKEGADWYLRIYADKEGGIVVDDCELLSKRLSKALDEQDPIPGKYYLEVSSPGIERRLRQPWHFEKYLSDVVEVKLYKALEGKKRLIGKLIKYDQVYLTVQEGTNEYTIPMDQVGIVKLHYDFGGNERK